MRGKERKSGVHRDSSRITPAYAGKSSGLWNREWKRKDHPRLCGEKHLFQAVFAHPRGSPPPMRGKAEKVQKCCCAIGITPAYAGKSCELLSYRCGIQDHPRLCGEKRYQLQSNSGNRGSPPPMRGKGRDYAQNCGYCGITPAYAGKRQIFLA